MAINISPLRFALAGGAALLGLTAAWSGVQADTGKRLAYSQRLGAEVFAIGGADWCKEETTVQVIADSKDLFTRSDFEALIKSLGTRVLAGECPAAKTLLISGIEKASGSVAWSGKAEGAAWKPVQVVDTPKPDPGDASARDDKAGKPKDGEAVKPVATPALPVPSSPLGGEWTAEVVCNTWSESGRSRLALSVYEVPGSRLKAVWERRSQDGGVDRSYVDGVYDDLTNQIKVTTTQNGVIRNAHRAQVDYFGSFDPKGGRLTVNGLCGGQQNVVMSRATPVPLTAHRVLADLTRRTAWSEEERRRLREHRIVGKLPRGEFRAPGCAEFVAWAGSFPAEQRVRLFPGSNGMLRHFDDATSQRVFGSPAYYWLGAEDDRGRTPVQLNDVAYKACGNAYHSNDPGIRALHKVVQDYTSTNEFRERRRYDDALATLAPYLATLGDEPSDAVAGLNRFATIAGIEQHIGEFRLYANSLSPEDKAAVIKDVDRYKAKLAAAAGEAKVREIAALPARFDSLDQLAKTRKEFVGLFGEAASASVAKAVDDRRLAIARTLADTAVAELGTTPRTFDGMMDADLKMSELRDKLGGDPAFEPLLRDLGAAESRFRQEAREAVIRSEQEALAATPTSLDGARTLVAHAKDLEKALGKDAGPSFAAYQKAVMAKVGEIGAAVLPEIRTELAVLPVRWSSIDDARKIAAANAVAVAGTPAEAAITKDGENRIQAILAELADQAILDVKGAQGDGLKGVDAAIAEAEKAAQAFTRIEGATLHAGRIKEAGRKRANEIAEAYLPEFRSEVKNAPISRFTAIQMAAASIILDQMAKEVPAFGKLRDIAREGGIAMYAGVCDKAIADAGIGGSDGKTEVLVGSEIGTLKQFVCDLREGGIRAVKFETPGLMKSITGGDKEYVLRVYAAEDKIARAAQGVFARALIGNAPRFASKEELFDFGGVHKVENASDKSGIESPAKIVFKEMEVRQDRKALVGVQIGDDAKTESLSLKQWREASAGLSSLGGGGPDQGKLCATWAKGGTQELGPYNAGLALLTCATKK